MSNGAVQGRCGTAAVAMAAHKRNVPVLFTCETYKLCDKVVVNDDMFLRRPMLFVYIMQVLHPLCSFSRDRGVFFSLLVCFDAVANWHCFSLLLNGQKVSLDSIVANELGDPRKLQRPKFAYSSAGSNTSSTSSSGGGPNNSDAGTGDVADSSNNDPSTAGSSKKTSPRLLNLQFDLTPIKFVGMVVTEVGLIPPTAVPALLREYRKESGGVLASDL